MSINRWTEKEFQYLKDNYEHGLIEDIAAFLGRSKDAVKTKVIELGLRLTDEERIRRKRAGQRKAQQSFMLTQSEHDTIKALYLEMPVKTLARHIGRSATAVLNSLKIQGLSIPKELIKKRKDLSHYRKGQVPPNKGKKMEEYLKADVIEKIKQTTFKKGQLPHNTHPEGAIVKRGDGYYYKRVEKGKWITYHQWLYEQHYGKIPKGHVVHFINGDREDVRIENLKLVSRKDSTTKAVEIIKEMQANLSPNYVAGILKRSTGGLLKREDMPELLIDLKTQQIKVKRQLAALENS